MGETANGKWEMGNSSEVDARQRVRGCAATDSAFQTLIYVVSAVRSELVAVEFIWCVVGCLVYWLKN